MSSIETLTEEIKKQAEQLAEMRKAIEDLSAHKAEAPLVVIKHTSIHIGKHTTAEDIRTGLKEAFAKMFSDMGRSPQ